MIIIDAWSGSIHWASVVVTDRSREWNNISYSFPSKPYIGSGYVLYDYEVPHEMTYPMIQQYLTVDNLNCFEVTCFQINDTIAYPIMEIIDIIGYDIHATTRRLRINFSPDWRIIDQ